ncbi:5921_t:CDS:2, partial [Racocetra fulgida]
ENTVLRAALTPQMVSVIPNAVVTSQFKPNPSAQDKNFKSFYYCDISQKILLKKSYKGGDGPKRIDLEQMREKNSLHDRVEFIGPVMHHEVHSVRKKIHTWFCSCVASNSLQLYITLFQVLTKGHIFLNTSLTEAFCIGMVEAACCGLLVVSTKVGGVPEVLPRHMIIFSKPEEEDLVDAVSKAIKMIRHKEAVPTKFHDEIKEMYSWSNVAERTEKKGDNIVI